MQEIAPKVERCANCLHSIFTGYSYECKKYKRLVSYYDSCEDWEDPLCLES